MLDRDRIFYDPEITPPTKKYSVWYNGQLIHFGQKGYQQYRDSTPLRKYKSLDHRDKKRRDAYRARHGQVLKRDGTPAYLDKNQPAYWSWHYLW